MSCATVAAFLAEWAEESEGTRRYMEALTDASLGTRVGPGERTLGGMAWHISETIPEMMSKTGLALTALPHEPPAATLSSAATLAKTYAEAAAELARAVKASWTDATLEIEDEMYGNRWKRGYTLRCLISHQAHHRGQMSILLRMAGLKVPAYYGPTREDWATMGMQPPKV